VRRTFAAKVFRTLANYDSTIATYFEGITAGDAKSELFPQTSSVALTKVADLRYGENPHQKAALYTSLGSSLPLLSGTTWEQLGGKELSYNNMLDLDAALRLAADFPTTSTVVGILKHLNPCGIAIGRDITDAIQRAKQCDPRSHFGGVLVTNTTVGKEAAEEIREDFAELVIAPSFSDDALAVLRSSKNLRILKVRMEALRGFEVRSVVGGLLVQEPDISRSLLSKSECVSTRAPNDEELVDLDLAWRIVGHVKSNAIVLVRDGLLIGVGAGQMSRIDSIELAIRKASFHGHLLQGAVAASDAFFPFPDSVTALADVGVTCIVSPGGAKRDDEVKEAANKRGVSLIFTPDRHFKH
jgi:phosphoribosylaminoimidazolecarboxamide formyltransferase/IMP cyclohydrolase